MAEVKKANLIKSQRDVNPTGKLKEKAAGIDPYRVCETYGP